jgi:hypothetical protein
MLILFDSFVLLSHLYVGLGGWFNFFKLYQNGDIMSFLKIFYLVFSYHIKIYLWIIMMKFKIIMI